MIKINIYDKEQLKSLVADHSAKGLITVKQSTKYPDLRVVKYARRCFYDNIWNDFLKECRGLVIDQDYNVVVHPLTKIFNYGENGWFPDISKTDEIYVHRKYNGFLGCVTWYKGQVLFSTTGSLDSTFVKLVEETYYNHILPNMGDPNWDPNKVETSKTTYYFEICHPSDPHIIRESEPFYLLGKRTAGSSFIHCKLNRVNRFSCLNDIFHSSDKIEGYICTVPQTGEQFKIKTPYYLRQKFFARANINKLENVLKYGSTVNENYLSNFDEDLYHIVDIVKQNKDEFLSMNEQERLLFIEQELKG